MRQAAGTMNPQPSESSTRNAPAEPAAGDGPETGVAPADHHAGPPTAENLFKSLVVALPGRGAGPSADRLDAFLQAATDIEALRLWFGTHTGLTRQQMVERLNRAVATIDALLSAQLNCILHHPHFQKLEAAWRGLRRLVEQVEAEGAVDVKVRFLSVTWRELERDFELAVDFDQSQLFRKVYDAEFGMPGGEPFGVLLGDYEIRPVLSADHPHNDVAVLASIAGVAAAAFCPFIASASPAMFGLDAFSDLETAPDLARGFQQMDFLKWRAFRDTEDARFVGLTLPRVLVRLPHTDDGSRVDRFRFEEDVAGPDHRRYLWGSAALAFGEVLIRSFAHSGWLAGIRGVERGVVAGGLVTRLPVHCFSTDTPGLAPKCSTDVVITDLQEKELSRLGFIPLCACHDSEYAAFFSNESAHKPRTYDRPEASRNARISSMLQYTLCASRFAHYLKVLIRDSLGGFREAHDCERLLQDWIVQYVTPDEDASPEAKARRPLREARISVRPDRADPGKYRCTFHLWPHFELDDLVAAVRLDTELGPELTPRM